jgi:hypothetical protein
MAKSKNKGAKKALLKKLVKGKKANKDGKSPLKMDNSLGKTPLKPSTIGDGGGSNLGLNGIF